MISDLDVSNRRSPHRRGPPDLVGRAEIGTALLERLQTVDVPVVARKSGGSPAAPARKNRVNSAVRMDPPQKNPQTDTISAHKPGEPSPAPELASVWHRKRINGFCCFPPTATGLRMDLVDTVATVT